MQQQKAKATDTQTTTSRTPAKTQRVPRQARREAVHTKEVRDSNSPVFAPCSLRGPDGQNRPGWELWVGDILFGRADTKESLLQYYTRIHEPMPSGHWKDRTWQGSAKVARRSRGEQYESYDEDLQFENDLTGAWD
jgi:hypothetical protein